MAISLKADLTDLDRLPGAMNAVVQETTATVSTQANDLAQTIKDRVRADIRAAGRFGSRWTDGFTVDVSADGNGNITIKGGMQAEHWTVFQYGAVIHGKPWLWFAPKPGTVTDKFGRTPRVIRKRSVNIPKKFHILEIIEEETQKAGGIFKNITPPG